MKKWTYIYDKSRIQIGKKSNNQINTSAAFITDSTVRMHDQAIVVCGHSVHSIC